MPTSRWRRNNPWCVSWSPDGARLASAANGLDAILVWDAATGQVLQRWEHDSHRACVAWSPDSRALALKVSYPRDQVLQVVDAATGRRLREFVGHTGKIECVAWSSDGRWLASGADDHAVRLWNGETGEAVGEPLIAHQDNVNDVAFTSDGKRIVSASDDGRVLLWDVETGKPLGQLLRGAIIAGETCTNCPLP